MNDTAAQYLVFTAGGIACAIAVSAVREVARELPFAPVPAAPRGVAGIVNLRGHVLPALDMACLLEGTASSSAAMNIIADAGGTFYSLLVETCGDVVIFAPEKLEPLPAGAPKWGFAAQKICRHENRIMPVIDMKRLADKIAAAAQRQGSAP
ncbi:MAG: chemotaxis protein CheW [Alphaproteobacteria bacterium]|nr:chemotaxis protein CheW [Alphaproteobacteria bacterium]